MKILIIIILLFLSCNQNSSNGFNQKSLTQLRQENEALKIEINRRNWYIRTAMKIIRDVNGSLSRVNRTHILLVKHTEEMKSNEGVQLKKMGSEMLNEIQIINENLQENRKKLKSLEIQLRSFKKKFIQLNLIIEDFKKNISQKQEEINRLKSRIESQIAVISALRKEILSKKISIHDRNKIIKEQVAIVDKSLKELNTMCYIIGKKKVLKKIGIIHNEGGFLGVASTIVLSHPLKLNKFHHIDKYQKEIVIGSKIKKIIPDRDKSCYHTSGSGKNTILVIDKPGLFWQQNYVVIIK